MTKECWRIREQGPEVTLVFWLTKIAAMSLGKTGSDSVTMT